MVELARLERVYGCKVIQGSNPCLSAIKSSLSVEDRLFFCAEARTTNYRSFLYNTSYSSMTALKSSGQAPKDLHVYVDFDRTLFDTASFGQDLFRGIARRANVSVEQAIANASPFYTHTTLRSFDFEGYVATYGLSPGKMLDYVSQLVLANDYLYADSAAFIQALHRQGFNPKILSFGEDRFQRAKIAPTLAPLLGDASPKESAAMKAMEVYVVLEPKGQHIASKHPGERGVLIDDVPDQQLPPGFHEIHLSRDSNLEKPLTKTGGFTVSDLLQAYEAITRIATS